MSVVRSTVVFHDKGRRRARRCPFSLPDRPPQPATIAALAVLGVICTGFTLGMFYTLITEPGPARAAVAFYPSPAFAVVFGTPFLGEPITTIPA